MTRPPSRSRPGARIAALLALALVALAGVVVPVVHDDPAHAAVMGAGYRGITPYGGYLGNYIAPDGTRVYCIDSALDWPSGSTDAGTIVGSVPTSWGQWLDEETVRKLNFALLTWGQTADPTNAAAVNAYLYAYTSNAARTSGPGYHAGLHYIGSNAAVKAAYDVVWRESETRYRGSGTAAATVEIDTTGWDGSVRVSVSPSKARGTLQLTGATVAGTDRTTIDVGDGSVVPIRVVAADDAASSIVSAEAQFRIERGAGATIVLYSTPGQQRTIRGAFPETVDVRARDEATADLRFAPIVTTQVASRFVSDGDSFVDTVTATVAPGSAAWRDRDGEPVPVIAEGTLYGPFPEQPAVADAPPTDAPVAGSERLTLAGPGTYRSSGAIRADRPGFYTWVWSVRSAQQPTAVQEMLPDDYAFADRFGLVAESHVVPARLEAVSQVSTAQTGFGGSITDELAVSVVEGPWLMDGGRPIEARFEGTAYFVPGTEAPQESGEVPPGAEVVGTAQIVATEPGVHVADTAVVAPYREGFVTWVWRLDPDSPTAPYFQPWSDRFGIPAETTRIAPPTVSTLAVEGAAIGDPVHDEALVGGTLPADPVSLVFQAYLQPSGADDARCDESTLVFDSHDSPVPVTDVGSYRSPEARFTDYGTYFWVESLYGPDGELLHRGECGAPEETTIVSPAEVVTQAAARIEPGGAAFDTARVTGHTPRGSTLVFRAYDQRGVLDGPLCDESTLLFESEPVAVTGSGLYRSEETTIDVPGRYFWVETLYDGNGEPLHVGECGIASETTHVVTDGLARTGADVRGALASAIAVLVAGAAALAWGIRRSARR